MTFAFFGTDEFSVKVLETLKEHGLIPKLIVTMPDKPQGRKMIITPPPVKIWGKENRIEVIQPPSLRYPKSDLITQSTTSNLFVQNFDFFLVASYGKIIPQEILDLPTHGALNIHPSLLPKYRGPSPLATAILNGDAETGVTIIKLDAEMDHGPIIASESLDLSSGQGIPLYNFEQLRDKSAILGAKLLSQILPAYLAGKIEPQEQDHHNTTCTKKFTKEDGRLGLQDLPLINYRKILALNPWPGTYLDYPGPAGKIRVIVKRAHLRPAVAGEENKLVYDLVVPAGRREMTWQSFLAGLK